ncbi:MAG: nuclear transport factor 2 family protein [Acidobacteria bacterium]|nr:nuclear transport factor 2 family protein [Acidobacteriota bacterium]
MKASQPPENPREREIYDQVIRVYKAYAEKDVETLKEIYPTTTDLILFLEGPHMKLVGWETFEKFFVEFGLAYDVVCTPGADFRYVRADENAGFAYGTVINVCKEKSTGFPVRWMARTTICLVKVDGKWKMIHHHDSVPGNIAFIMEGPEEGEGGHFHVAG